MKLRFQIGALIFAALLAGQSAVASSACPAMLPGVEGTSTTCGFKGCEGHGQLLTPNPTKSSKATCCQVGLLATVRPARASRAEKQREVSLCHPSLPNQMQSSAGAIVAARCPGIFRPTAKSLQALYCQIRT